jgi:hypothetical protein
MSWAATRSGNLVARPALEDIRFSLAKGLASRKKPIITAYPASGNGHL